MLNRNIDSIIYQSYLKLGDIALSISKNIKIGNDNTRKQKDLYNKGILVYSYLKVIGDHIVVKDNSVYQLRDITEAEMNKLLVCLAEAADINNYPVIAGILQFPKKTVISSGAAGPTGANGTSAYVAVVFAEDTNGTNLSIVPDISRPYLAVKTSTSPIPLVAATFTGLWVNYFGENGANGNNGVDGEDSFVYIRYASDASGSNFSVTPDISRKYIAVLTSSTDLGTPTSTAFNGLWVKYLGDDGNPGIDGADGNTILSGAGAPDDLIGVDGDFYIDISAWYVYGPKVSSTWPAGVSIVGPTGSTGSNGTDGSDGNDGDNAYLYIAWADNSSGSGFTMTFDQNKNYIALLQSNTIITPTVSDFTGLWTKYAGDGDRWSTTSTTSATIGTGIKNFVVGLNLAYSTGQRVVVAENNNEDNRMEGYCRSYEPTTGQLYVDIDNVVGSGTFSTWDVNLFGVPVQLLTIDAYSGEIYIEDNAGGTPQSVDTTFTKINQFDTDGDATPGVTLDNANDQLTIGVKGFYGITADLSAIGDNSAGYIIQVFVNGVAESGARTRQDFAATASIQHFAINTKRELQAGDVIDVRVKTASGTHDFLVIDGRLSVSSLSSLDEYATSFENLDVDTGTEVVDSFPASSGDGADWTVVIKKGTVRKKLLIAATWESTNSNYNIDSTVSIGTCDVTLSVDIDSGNVRLLATATSDNWIVTGKRTIV